MYAPIRTKASLVWSILVALTAVSWLLGTDQGFASGGHRVASVVIVAVVVFKVRIIGLQFMDLRGAPNALRSLFNGYCAVMFGVVTGMFLWG